MISARSPANSSWAAIPPTGGSWRASVCRRLCSSPRRRLASVPSSDSTMRRPSVLTRSGSSTPASWMLVVEYAGGAASPLAASSPPVGRAGAGVGRCLRHQAFRVSQPFTEPVRRHELRCRLLELLQGVVARVVPHQLVGRGNLAKRWLPGPRARAGTQRKHRPGQARDDERRFPPDLHAPWTVLGGGWFPQLPT